MSDISKQLCELAGIEAQSYYAVNKNDSRELKRVYPSFENSENFVNLLEVMFLFKFNFKELDTYVESVLNGALEEVKAGNAEFIKLLQEQEWSY